MNPTIDLPFDPTKNLLPEDGQVYYHGKIYSNAEANKWYRMLLRHTPWQHDQSVILGKLVTTKRKVAWYGNEAYSYTYSQITKQAMPWTKELEQIKKVVEESTCETYNSCLMNLYHSGKEGVSWHSDGEKALKKNGAIASLSFGAERKFSLKHKSSKQRIDILLEHGGLLLMTGTTQKHWLHSIPKSKKILDPRISLTFRTICYSNAEM